MMFLEISAKLRDFFYDETIHINRGFSLLTRSEEICRQRFGKSTPKMSANQSKDDRKGVM